MTQAHWAFGTELLKNGVKIAEITDIGSPDLDADEVDVTSHDSPDGFEEVLMGIKRTGVVNLEGFFVPGDAGQQALMTDYNSGASDSYKIKFPAAMAAEWNFTGRIKKAPTTGAPVDGAVPFNAEIRVTGKPTLDLTYSNNLSALAVTTGTLVPGFAAGTYAYHVNVLTGASSVAVTPTAGAGVITVNGTVVSSGAASGAITLGSAGSLTPIQIVVKETNKIARVYNLVVARP